MVIQCNPKDYLNTLYYHWKIRGMNTDNRPPPYSMRLDPDLRAKLEAVAKANGRSLHAEISMRLEASLQQGIEFTSSESPYVTIDEMKAAMKDSFQKLYNDLIKAGLKPVSPYPDLDKILDESHPKAGK